MALRGEVDVWARSQSLSLRYRAASPSGPGPSVAARHLPTLWGVTLYTREPLGACVEANSVRPGNLAATPNPAGEHCSPLQQQCGCGHLIGSP